MQADAADFDLREERGQDRHVLGRVAFLAYLAREAWPSVDVGLSWQRVKRVT